ncbi:hypothetical protein BDW67DRAFT_160956 [Aspergillus spinulosporus]
MALMKQDIELSFDDTVCDWCHRHHVIYANMNDSTTGIELGYGRIPIRPWWSAHLNKPDKLPSQLLSPWKSLPHSTDELSGRKKLGTYSEKKGTDKFGGSLYGMPDEESTLQLQGVGPTLPPTGSLELIIVGERTPSREYPGSDTWFITGFSRRDVLPRLMSARRSFNGGRKVPKNSKRELERTRYFLR